MLWDYVQDHPRAVAERQQLLLVLVWTGIALAVFFTQPPGGTWWVLGSWAVTTAWFYFTDRERARNVQHRMNQHRDLFNAAVAQKRRDAPWWHIRPSEEQLFRDWMQEQPAPSEWVPVRPLPVIPLYCLLSLAALALYGTRDLLAHRHLGIGPEQAPAVIATVAGLPGLLVAVLMVIPRVIRAWGAASRDANTGEAALIRAQAELRRAEADYLRAQKGLPAEGGGSPDPDALPPAPEGATPP